MSFVGFRVGEAAGFPPAKMKRKELEDVANEFSEFSLSSPARKIRRLDLGLPPIFEEEESRSSFIMDQFQSDSKQLSSLPEADISSSSNEERALVLYRPLYSPLPEPDVPDVSFKVDPEWMSNFNSRTLQSGYSNKMVSSTGQSSFRADNTEEPSVCMDVVPWTRSHLSEVTNFVERASSKLLNEEEMDTEEEGTAMEVEEPQTTIESGPLATGRKETSHLQQCQQHYCMNPPTNPSPSTPVMWSW